MVMAVFGNQRSRSKGVISIKTYCTMRIYNPINSSTQTNRYSIYHLPPPHLNAVGFTVYPILDLHFKMNLGLEKIMKVF